MTEPTLSQTLDNLNTVGVLTRREIEARLIAPLIEAFAAEIGRERALEITRDVITRIAYSQGQAMARLMGGCTLAHFMTTLEAWEKDNALQISTLEQSKTTLSFNVTRCRYAEMYRDLGIPELGVILSCNRDFALIRGFNPEIKLTRTQTIMEGADFCDFRYSTQAQK
jgi:hypothetical protein